MFIFNCLSKSKAVPSEHSTFRSQLIFHRKSVKDAFQIPWSALNVSPIIVQLSDVDINAEPFSEWNHDVLLKTKSMAKRSEIVAAELRRVSIENAAPKHSFWLIGGHIWNALLRRLRIQIQNVHISFQGQELDASRYAFGLKIDNIYTQEGLDIAERQPRNPLPGNEILKSIKIEDLAIYWDPDTKTEKSSLFLLNPMMAEVFLYLRSPNALHGKEIEIQIKVECIDTALTDHQIVSIASFVDDWSIWQKRREFGHFRPEAWKSKYEQLLQGIQMKNRVDYISVWKYAIRSVLQV